MIPCHDGAYKETKSCFCSEKHWCIVLCTHQEPAITFSWHGYFYLSVTASRMLLAVIGMKMLERSIMLGCSELSWFVWRSRLDLKKVIFWAGSIALWSVLSPNLFLSIPSKSLISLALYFQWKKKKCTQNFAWMLSWCCPLINII